MRVHHLPAFLTGLSSSPRDERRDPRPAPSFPAQCTFPRRPDAPRPRGDPRRDFRRVEPRLARALPLQARRVMSPILPLFAQVATPAAGGSGMTQIILQLVLLGAIFYFLIIRPGQKQRKQQENAIFN